jgi:hypothetical protein
MLSDELARGLTIATGKMPNGVYEEIEIELDRYKRDPGSKMYNRTVFIEGKINGNDMEMWYSSDYSFEIEFPETKQNIVLSGDDLKIFIDFRMDKMFETLNSIDFSGAKDGNGNGIIEIGPNNVDGNQYYARQFFRAIFKSFYLHDDDDDDDDDDD